MLYSHLLIHAEIYIYILDTYRRNDNRRMINDRRTNKGRRKEDTGRLLYKYIYLSLYCKGSKGLFKVCMWEGAETEHKLHILTSTTYDRHVVSFLFSWCSTGGLGLTLLDAGFLYCILSASSLDPSSSGVQAPSAWCGFPYHISSLTLWKSAGNCFGTQLNSII